MSSYYQTHYSTGEFAKLCHTTKETLFHYDELGLLKPDIVKNNGYRYYLSKQYFEFDLIKVLQETHMSLKEIYSFMNQRTQQNYIDLLKQKNKELEEEKRKIESMQHRIQQAIYMTEYGMHTKHNIPFVEYCEEEHLLTIQLPNHDMDDKEMMEYVSRHLAYCQKHHLTEEIPLGTILYKQQVLQHNYREDRYFVKVNKKIENDNYWLKEKGLYVKILHEGFYDTIDQSFDKIFDYIQKNDYEMIGDVYEFEIHNYFISSDIKHYLIQIEVPIKKIDKAKKII